MSANVTVVAAANRCCRRISGREDADMHAKDCDEDRSEFKQKHKHEMTWLERYNDPQNQFTGT